MRCVRGGFRARDGRRNLVARLAKVVEEERHQRRERKETKRRKLSEIQEEEQEERQREQEQKEEEKENGEQAEEKEEEEENEEEKEEGEGGDSEKRVSVKEGAEEGEEYMIKRVKRRESNGTSEKTKGKDGQECGFESFFKVIETSKPKDLGAGGLATPPSPSASVRTSSSCCLSPLFLFSFLLFSFFFPPCSVFFPPRSFLLPFFLSCFVGFFLGSACSSFLSFLFLLPSPTVRVPFLNLSS